MTGERRGQFVLLAAIALVVALVPLVFAYLQLGYHADLRTSPIDDDRLADVDRALARAVHDAGASVPGTFSWRRRGAAVDAVTSALGEAFRRINRSRLVGGTVIRVNTITPPARRWATTHCPTGPGREFGDCLVDSGLVLQRRANRTHVLAVGVQIRIDGDGHQAHHDRVVEVWPGDGATEGNRRP